MSAGCFQDEGSCFCLLPLPFSLEIVFFPRSICIYFDGKPVLWITVALSVIFNCSLASQMYSLAKDCSLFIWRCSHSLGDALADSEETRRAASSEEEDSNDEEQSIGELLPSSSSSCRWWGLPAIIKHSLCSVDVECLCIVLSPCGLNHCCFYSLCYAEPAAKRTKKGRGKNPVPLRWSLDKDDKYVLVVFLVGILQTCL